MYSVFDNYNDFTPLNIIFVIDARSKERVGTFSHISMPALKKMQTQYNKCEFVLYITDDLDCSASITRKKNKINFVLKNGDEELMQFINSYGTECLIVFFKFPLLTTMLYSFLENTKVLGYIECNTLKEFEQNEIVFNHNRTWTMFSDKTKKALLNKKRPLVPLCKSDNTLLYLEPIKTKKQNPKKKTNSEPQKKEKARFDGLPRNPNKYYIPAPIPGTELSRRDLETISKNNTPVEGYQRELQYGFEGVEHYKRIFGGVLESWRESMMEYYLLYGCQDEVHLSENIIAWRDNLVETSIADLKKSLKQLCDEYQQWIDKETVTKVWAVKGYPDSNIYAVKEEDYNDTQAVIHLTSRQFYNKNNILETVDASFSFYRKDSQFVQELLNKINDDFQRDYKYSRNVISSINPEKRSDVSNALFGNMINTLRFNHDNKLIDNYSASVNNETQKQLPLYMILAQELIFMKSLNSLAEEFNIFLDKLNLKKETTNVKLTKEEILFLNTLSDSRSYLRIAAERGINKNIDMHFFEKQESEYRNRGGKYNVLHALTEEQKMLLTHIMQFNNNFIAMLKEEDKWNV